jgi:heme/copper-type cytochrome/quinol oxidase subunit 3
MALPLALPSGRPARPRNLLNVATLVIVTGGTALFAALISAYAGLAHFAKVWPPHGVKVDDYVGNMLALTAIMSAITVEWAWYSIKRDDPAQATWGLVLTTGFGASFILLLWQLGRRAGFGPGTAKIGPFAVVYFAMLGAIGLIALFGLVAVLMALARTIGRQFSSTNHEMLRATAWIWDFVVVCWIAIFATIWLFT